MKLRSEWQSDDHTRTKAEVGALQESHLGLKGCLERFRCDLNGDHAGAKMELDTLKKNYAALKEESKRLDGLEEEYLCVKAELDTLKVDHAGTKAELDQSKVAIQSAETKIKSLEAELASFPEPMAVDKRDGDEPEEIRDKLQATELTIQELRDQVASVSANLDVLIANAPRITKVM